jgi:N-acetylmuramoyl-L-alanine amidase
MKNMINRPSPNFNLRPTGTEVDMLVLHYTGMKSSEEALDRMCDKTSEVSAHYMIDGAGLIYQLVEEASRAWHAGVSSWRGHTNMNDRSIGIELANPGHEFGYRAFPAAQMAALISLITEINQRQSIPTRNIVGHSDIAPARKLDPGELFDWMKLAERGIGEWPKDALSEVDLVPPDFSAALNKYGYDVADLSAATIAFQRHFRASLCNGIADVETQKILGSLLNGV